MPKLTDPTLITANIIARNMSNTALEYRNKAPYDKSYKAVILGTNRKFTDDVTVEEQAELEVIASWVLPNDKLSIL